MHDDRDKDGTDEPGAEAEQALRYGELTARLIRRHTESIGLIDVLEVQRRYERLTDWVAQRSALAEELKARYSADEAISTAPQSLLMKQAEDDWDSFSADTSFLTNQSSSASQSLPPPASVLSRAENPTAPPGRPADSSPATETFRVSRKRPQPGLISRPAASTSEPLAEDLIETSRAERAEGLRAKPEAERPAAEAANDRTAQPKDVTAKAEQPLLSSQVSSPQISSPQISSSQVSDSSASSSRPAEPARVEVIRAETAVNRDRLAQGPELVLQTTSAEKAGQPYEQHSNATSENQNADAIRNNPSQPALRAAKALPDKEETAVRLPLVKADAALPLSRLAPLPAVSHPATPQPEQQSPRGERENDPVVPVVTAEVRSNPAHLPVIVWRETAGAPAPDGFGPAESNSRAPALSRQGESSASEQAQKNIKTVVTSNAEPPRQQEIDFERVSKRAIRAISRKIIRSISISLAVERERRGGK
jgi:hypothetical protein